MIADKLLAHTAFASHGYFMSVNGFLFLGHGTSPHHEAEAAIETIGEHLTSIEKAARSKRADLIRHCHAGAYG